MFKGPLSQLCWCDYLTNLQTEDTIPQIYKLNIVLFTADDASLYGANLSEPCIINLVGLHRAHVLCMQACLLACLLGMSPLLQLHCPLSWWIVWRQFINIYHPTYSSIKPHEFDTPHWTDEKNLQSSLFALPVNTCRHLATYHVSFW